MANMAPATPMVNVKIPAASIARLTSVHFVTTDRSTNHLRSGQFGLSIQRLVQEPTKNVGPNLFLLLPLPFDVELLLLAVELRRSFTFDLVAIDCQGVLNGNRTTHHLSLGTERQLAVFELQVLGLFVLLVRPVHRPGELVAVLRDRQCDCPRLVADFVIALPRPDR